MWPQVRLVQLFEITAVVGVTLAFDRMPALWDISGLAPALLSIIACGTLTGVYLGFRWSSQRDVWSIVAASGVAAAIATILNATRIGISIAEDLRRATDGSYFNWRTDAPQLVAWILAVTMTTVLLAAGLAAILAIISRACRILIDGIAPPGPS
jgi:hypothetical protein